MGSTPKPIETGITIGQVFLGKYRVDAILGHGGMGVVAQCTHLQLQDRVAIKMLRPDVLGDDDAVQRFVREAQAAVKLKSEYVAKVTDVGTFENGVPYMVMEYLDGQDMGNLLDERKVLPMPWATDLVLQAAEALAEAHAAGIVHRDVKPTNLFVTWRPDGSALVKVLDFGISKMSTLTAADAKLTQTQSLLGTPAYMSPEQMRSARLVDGRSDLWSLGTVLYEAIEGRRPFEAESFSEMVVKVSVDPPLPMRNAPPALQQVIFRCLAKTPEQRYANMAELGRDLLPFSQDQHGGLIMVERMERMARRAAAAGGAAGSSGEWSENSSPSGRVPQAVRDAVSNAISRQTPMPGQQPTPPPGHMYAQMPVQMPGPGSFGGDSQPYAQPWAGGSQPAAQPWAGGTDPSGASFSARPRHVVDTTLLVRPRPGASGGKKSSLWLVLLAIGVLGGAGVGIAVAMTKQGGGGGPTAKTAVPEPAPIQMNVAPAAPPAPAATTAAAPSASPSPSPSPSASPSPSPSGSAAPSPSASPSPSPSPSHPHPSHPAHPVEIKQEPASPPPPVVDPPKAPKPCGGDVYGAPRPC